MRHRDFGHLDGPVVLFGGAYSNLQATLALFETAGSREVVSTGDLVAYCADPLSTVAAYMVEDCYGIAGNCERQLATDAEDCGCGFGADSACDILSRGWYPFARSAMTAEAVADLARLPDIGSFVHCGKRFAVVHGGATSINRFIWPSSPEAVFLEEISAIETDIGPIDGVVAGHSGIAFHRVIGRYRWINAGAIGLPPHDGRPETRYAILERDDVTFQRLRYDHEAARMAMENAGLTQGYEKTLTTGIWPSEDVLPPELRR